MRYVAAPVKFREFCKRDEVRISAFLPCTCERDACTCHRGYGSTEVAAFADLLQKLGYRESSEVWTELAHICREHSHGALDAALVLGRYLKEQARLGAMSFDPSDLVASEKYGNAALALAQFCQKHGGSK